MARRAVIFDLDGTLLDTLADIACAMNRVLAGRGLEQHSVTDYRMFVGDGAEMLVRKTLSGHGAGEDMIGQCLAGFKAVYAECWHVHTKPYPGIPELLDALDRSGVPMAVLSNKPHELTVSCVAAFLPRWRFASVLGEQAGRPRKPDPAGAFEIAGCLQVPPQDIVYLGDTATDMQTAIAAGMLPVGALWGFRPAAELLEGGARHLIETPAGLMNIVGLE
jgi:phosphoglycolate phosphatase